MLWGKGADIPVIGHLLDYLWENKPSTEHCIGNLVSFPFFPLVCVPTGGDVSGRYIDPFNHLHWSKHVSSLYMIQWILMIVTCR
jgi:hypothetical protein